jgi:predicted nucleotidyltransferase
MKEMMMLELTAIDLGGLTEALEDHSEFLRWFIDPSSGNIIPWSEDMDESHPEERGAIFINPISSSESYKDLRDFVDRVSDRRAADLLSRSIEGRGAFRRFKDTLFEFPELRQSWFAFHDTRMRRRAIEWLSDMGLIDETAANAELATLKDPTVGQGVVDPYELARQVARELRELFGPRLVDVVLFGSYAMGTATDESDLDLVVLLRDVSSPWEDARRMDALLWEKTLEAGITISAVVVDAKEWRDPRRPLLQTAKVQGRSVA